MQWHRNGITYFFKENRFWRLDNRRMQATDDSPRLYQDYWFRSACLPKDSFPPDFDFDPINQGADVRLSAAALTAASLIAIRSALQDR